MAHFKRTQVLQIIENTGLVPVFYHADADVCRGVLEACYRGGIRAFEFTNRGDFAHETFGQLVRHVRQSLPEMAIGVGTVMEPGTASLYMQLGADFVISPVLNADIFKVCNRRKVLHVPGCATLSEISQAEEYGADVVKVFPGDVLKPAFVKALKAPMPWTNVMVTGGVEPTRESLEAWFGAGVTAVGLGSQLFRKEWLQNREFGLIEAKVREVMEIFNGLTG
jgi:2-dehydro-3-deoxyphosphogluconate aldolase/(4S)-4-hydroxy-2-oxoglutarate aldolase